MQDAILILDHDAALAGLIARTLRSQQIYCKPVSSHITLAEALRQSPRGLILAARQDAPASLAGLDISLLTAGLPVLALGAMAPALCLHYGGTVLMREGENENITLGLDDQPLFEGMTRGERMLNALYDLTLPQELDCLATATERCIGFAGEGGRLFAVQYPIERNDPDAIQLLHNFATLVCGMEPVWSESYIIDRAVEGIRAAAGGNRVLCAVSGGVDSAVCAKLAHLAVGDRLVCVFVDTGLFRRGEPQAVIESYMETMGLVVAYEDAQETYLNALHGVTASADKERIASSLLRQVFDKQHSFDPDLHILVLGTNYNDTLYGFTPEQTPAGEAGATPLTVYEPVRGLFKDEVRRLARALSLPGAIADRQPFPASGLALRIYGEITPERLETLRKADAFFSEEILAGGHERKLWQYYAAMGENPDDQDGYVIILRASQACSGNACASRLPYDLLERAVERILAELPEVTRVLYDMTPSRHYSLME